ncbi:MAG TPA: SPOR domain-containing protein [Firmicutes bacterium]|nr:SPOR domain-containing protein [Bacillota bacterium]
MFIFVTKPFDSQGNYIIIKDKNGSAEPKPEPTPITPKPEPTPDKPPPSTNIGLDISDDLSELLDSQVTHGTFWVVEVATYTERKDAESSVEKIKKLGYNPVIEKIGVKFAVMIKHVKEDKADDVIKKLKDAGYTPSKEPEIEF